MATAQEVRISDDGSAEVIVGIATDMAPLPAQGTSVSGMPATSLRGEAELLFESGPFVTCTDCVFGADGSQLQNTTLGMSTFGFNNNQGAAEPFRLADHFEVTENGWDIDFVEVFGYQTGSPPTSSFMGVFMRIWDGVPDAPDSEIVFGDLVTNVMVETEFTGVHRFSETTLNEDRPIMVQTAAVDVFLEPGVYWLEWTQTGEIASGPWQLPITITGECVTGDGLRWLSVDEAPHEWVPAIDENSACPQGLPFRILGQFGVSGEPGPAAEAVTLETFPNPVSTSATIALRLAEATDVSLQVFDMLGRQLMVLAEGDLVAGDHEFALDTGGLASGLYVLRLAAGHLVQSHRITVIR